MKAGESPHEAHISCRVCEPERSHTLMWGQQDGASGYLRKAKDSILSPKDSTISGGFLKRQLIHVKQLVGNIEQHVIKNQTVKLQT